MISKILFLPLSVAGGILAGLVGKKLFERVWGLIDKEEPPGPRHRETSWLKLIAAMALEGAIFRAVRGAFDHGARRSFARLTGVWPGEEKPEPE
jgi:Protein of unknown function (DUF4235)